MLQRWAPGGPDDELQPWQGQVQAGPGSFLVGLLEAGVHHTEMIDALRWQFLTRPLEEHGQRASPALPAERGQAAGG